MSFWLIFNLVEWGLRLGMTAVILRRRFKPAVATAWLAVVFFLPELGLIFYLILGDGRLGRKRTRRHRLAIAAIRSENRLAAQGRHIVRPDIEPAHQPVIRQAQSIGGFNILGGNHVDLLDDCDTMIDRLVADIQAARHHVHLLFYIFANDVTGQRVGAALVAAQKRGVACRVLADAAGSWGFFQRHGLAANLQRHGVEVRPMLPAAPLRRKVARLDLRNHRKLAIIDGKIAYAGSQNIVNPDYGHKGLRWVDLMGRFTGPVVLQLQTVFLEDWAFETDVELITPDIFPTLDPVGAMSAQTVPTGPSYEMDVLPKVLLTALNAAERKVIITTPYVVPDEPTTLALAMAVDRGAEVNLLVPRRSDHLLVAAAGRAYYDELLAAGVKLFLYEKGLLHAKTMTVDDSFALLGSSNLDIRSFYLNFELNVLMYGPQITRQLRFAQMRYLADSTPLDKKVWSRRPRRQRYIEGAAALLSPLL